MLGASGGCKEGLSQGGPLSSNLGASNLGARVCSLLEAGSRWVGRTRRGEHVSRFSTRPWTGRAGARTGKASAPGRMCPAAPVSLSLSCAGALGWMAAVLLWAGSSSHKLHMKSPSACHASNQAHTAYNENGH